MMFKEFALPRFGRIVRRGLEGFLAIQTIPGEISAFSGKIELLNGKSSPPHGPGTRQKRFTLEISKAEFILKFLF